jgi:hypothetical protein
MMKSPVRTLILLATAAVLSTLPAAADAHCDTLDGPVVVEARAALEAGGIAPVLKWVRAEDEPEIVAAFDRTLRVRRLGGDARDLADTYFFETLVRVHRAGEGAPYTGLKPAGMPVEPAIAEADRAIETGSVEALVEVLTGEVSDGLRRRHAEVTALKAHSGHNVAAGRKYVAAYVDFIHFAERIHLSTSAPAHGAGTASDTGHEGH